MRSSLRLASLNQGQPECAGCSARRRMRPTSTASREGTDKLERLDDFGRRSPRQPALASIAGASCLCSRHSVSFGTLITSGAAPKGLRITIAGPSYPSPVNAEPLSQHFNLNLLCDSETSKVTFTSYDNKDLWLEWKAPAGCGSTSSDDGDTKKPEGQESQKSAARHYA